MNTKKIIASALAAGAMSAGLGMVMAAPAQAKTCSEVVDGINSEDGYTPTPGEKWACASVILGNKWATFPGQLEEKWTGYPDRLAEKWTAFPGDLADKWSNPAVGGYWGKDGTPGGGYANGKGGGAWSHTGE